MLGLVLALDLGSVVASTTLSVQGSAAGEHVPSSSGCTIRPGTLPLDSAGRAVHAHGGGVYVEGGWYYLVGTSIKQSVPVNKRRPSGAHVYLSRTINIYRSRTLCNWTLIRCVQSSSGEPVCS
eukprot:COSAG01_NODE_4826_length_4712_cov_21.963148_3_plen_123_part_00